MKDQNELLINDVASNNYEDIRNKQIVEIGQVMCNENNKEVADALSLLFATLAESLYNAGYSKQSVGEWKDLKIPKDLFACSLCDNRLYGAKTNFCPHCGAKMKGSADEN